MLYRIVQGYSPGEVYEKKKREEGKGEESDSNGVFGSWWLGTRMVRDNGRLTATKQRTTLALFPAFGCLDIGLPCDHRIYPLVCIKVVTFFYLLVERHTQAFGQWYSRRFRRRIPYFGGE
jgi:hypothetical protein